MFRQEIPAPRGEIIGKDASPFVSNQPAYLVYLEPKRVKEPIKVQKLLRETLDIDEATLASQMKSDLLWLPLKRRVSKEQIADVLKLGIEGIGSQEEDIRYYPEGSMSAHLLGFVGSAYDGSPKGYFGLEGYYDRELRGRYGVLRQAKDAKGDPILIGLSDRILAESGKSLQLHVDRAVQYLVEKKLLDGIQRYQAKGGTVTIMDPHSGAILAMAAFPAYDPRAFSEYPYELYKNPIISEAYEPGSTFKVLIMAAAIEHQLITPTTIFAEKGPVEVDGLHIKTWNDKYGGAITTKEILERSSNVGMVAIAQKLGKDRMVAAIEDFGFGKVTGVDLEEESSPTLRPKNEWRNIDLATASFGQGIAVTPIQMVRAVSAIANGGKIFTPRVVSSMIGDGNQPIEIKPQVIRQVITSRTAKTITEMMIAAVDNGEARFFKPRGYTIAGKTGTAQIPVAGHYDREKTIASFVGFAPAFNPVFTMLVTIREPTTSPWGSETAAPLFFEIAKELLLYYGVQPQ